jgi:hypothetical protein
VIEDMKPKVIPVAGLIAASALAIGGWMHFSRPAPHETAERVDEPKPLALPLISAPSAPPDIRPSVAESLPTLPSRSPAPVRPPISTTGKTSASAPPQSAIPVKRAKKPKPPLQDPTARVAMSFVGADLHAEAYWLEAIFDSSLPEKEREDLMEDLNEDGLSDHKHPGPDDLPLIMNRLAIIEAVAPHADEFMLPHLWEAYKDLINLAHITQGEGIPVR